MILELQYVEEITFTCKPFLLWLVRSSSRFPVVCQRCRWLRLVLRLRYQRLFMGLIFVSLFFFISGSTKSSRRAMSNITPAVPRRTLWKLLRLVLSCPAWVYICMPVTPDLSGWQPWEYRAQLHSMLTHYSFRCCEFIRPVMEGERRGRFIIFAVLSSRPNFLRRIEHQLERITSRSNSMSRQITFNKWRSSRRLLRSQRSSSSEWLTESAKISYGILRFKWPHKVCLPRGD